MGTVERALKLQAERRNIRDGHITVGYDSGITYHPPGNLTDGSDAVEELIRSAEDADEMDKLDADTSPDN